MHRKAVEDLPEFVALKAAAVYFEMVISRVSNIHNLVTSVIPMRAYDDLVTQMAARREAGV